MDKRKVTMMVGGHACTFVSDDPDAYLAALEARANAALRQTSSFSGASAYTTAILAVLSLTDQLMRMEQNAAAAAPDGGPPASKGKNPVPGGKNLPKAERKAERKPIGQISVWDLLEGKP